MMGMKDGFYPILRLIYSYKGNQQTNFELAGHLYIEHLLPLDKGLRGVKIPYFVGFYHLRTLSYLLFNFAISFYRV